MVRHKEITLRSYFYETKWLMFYHFVMNITIFYICIHFKNEIIFIIINNILFLFKNNYVSIINIKFQTNIYFIFAIPIYISLLSYIITLIFPLYFFFREGLTAYENAKAITYSVWFSIGFILYYLFTLSFLYYPLVYLINKYYNNNIINYSYIIEINDVLNLVLLFYKWLFITYILFWLIFILITKLKTIVIYSRLRFFFYTLVLVCIALLTPPDLFLLLLMTFIFIVFIESIIFSILTLKNIFKKVHS